MPLLKTQLQVKKMSVGDKLSVLCSDKNAMVDIRKWCDIKGHSFFSKPKLAAEQTYIVEITVLDAL